MQKAQARRRELARTVPPLVIAAFCTLLAVIAALLLLRNVTDTILASPARGGSLIYGLKTSICMLVATAVFMSTYAIAAKIIARVRHLRDGDKKSLRTLSGR